MPLYRDRKGQILCPGCDKAFALGNSDVSLPKPKKPETTTGQSTSGLSPPVTASQPQTLTQSQAQPQALQNSSSLFSMAKVTPQQSSFQPWPQATQPAAAQGPAYMSPNMPGTKNHQFSNPTGFAFASNLGTTQPSQTLLGNPFAPQPQPRPQTEIGRKLV